MNANGGWANSNDNGNGDDNRWLNLRKTEQENMTGNYDLRVCDETNVYSIRIYRLEEAETEQNHGQPNESFCTHTQIYLLSLMNIHWWNREYANLHKKKRESGRVEDKMRVSE